MGRDSSTSLAPGFRFHPTDEELVRYYLRRKVSGKPFRFDPISEVDIYKIEPWDLPGMAKLKTRDLEWYFFSGLDKKYGNGSRTNRATEKGYWKTTGKDRPVSHNSRIVGMKKTLVFHRGRAPKGERSNWVMHEYRLADEELEKAGIAQDAFVLCRIFQKSGSGPKNGEQYGAPFVEEEWDDEVAFVTGQEVQPDEFIYDDAEGQSTFEDVFPAEATSVEEYLQQLHEMAMVSAVQEAQKDNCRSFNNYMMEVLEEDWQKEKRDFLQSLSRISTLPRTNMIDTGIAGTRPGQIVSTTSSPQLSSRPSGMEVVPLANKPVLEKKASVYAEVVKNLNNARERGLTFQPATAFRGAYETLGLDASSGKSVTMQKIWHLIQTMMGEGSTIQRGVSKKMSLVIGARRHLEWGHEKYIMDSIHSHPAQAALGGAVGNLQKVHAFLRIRLRDYGVLDFDSVDARRQPPVDTTWQQIYFCLRTGFYDEARNVALSSRSSHQFAPLLTDWINSGGMVSVETANVAVEECEKMLRMGDRVGRATYDKKKLLLYAIVSGSRKQIDHLLRDLPTLFNTIEDFLWFKLSAVRDLPAGAPSVVLSEGLVPYSLDDLQVYLNKFEPSYYTKNGKDPLVYPYVLLLSVQLLPAVLYLSKESRYEGYNIDAVHISIVLADHGILSEGFGAGQKLGVMDAYAEISSIIRQYGSAYLRLDNLPVALEYYAQAAAAVGGGQLSWTGRGTLDQQRQRNLMLKQLLAELLLRDGGIYFLLGSRGAGEEGALGRFLTDGQVRQQFLLEAAHHCQETGLYDKSIEIHKRVGAFSMALDTINKCLSEAICALSRGRLDGESRTAGLVHSGNDLLETYKYYPEVSPKERDHVLEQQTVLRQLEAILSIHKLARAGLHVDALREVARLPFLPLDPRTPDIAADVFQNLSPHVQACVPDLLKIALSCLDNVTDSDGSLRALRAKIASFLANNMNRNWPRDLYEKVARSL